MTVDDVKNLKLNDFLGLVGVRTKRDTMDVLLPAMGLFAAGLLVGAGVGLLLAPTSGADLRNRLSTRINELGGEKLPGTAAEETASVGV